MGLLRAASYLLGLVFALPAVPFGAVATDHTGNDIDVIVAVLTPEAVALCHPPGRGLPQSSVKSISFIKSLAIAAHCWSVSWPSSAERLSEQWKTCPSSASLLENCLARSGLWQYPGQRHGSVRSRLAMP
jgi:hypothetical protein